jgi:hypothetical protein
MFRLLAKSSRLTTIVRSLSRARALSLTSQVGARFGQVPRDRFCEQGQFAAFMTVWGAFFWALWYRSGLIRCPPSADEQNCLNIFSTTRSSPTCQRPLATEDPDGSATAPVRTARAIRCWPISPQRSAGPRTVQTSRQSNTFGHASNRNWMIRREIPLARSAKLLPESGSKCLTKSRRSPAQS